jgi:hypothetical protein
MECGASSSHVAVDGERDSADTPAANAMFLPANLAGVSVRRVLCRDRNLQRRTVPMTALSRCQRTRALNARGHGLRVAQ